MFNKIASLKVLITLTSIFVISNQGFAAPDRAGNPVAVGLINGVNETAQTLYETSSSIRIKFTPPPSHNALSGETDAFRQLSYNLNDGYNMANGRKLPAITYWVVIPPRDHVELDIIEQKGRRLSTEALDMTTQFLSESIVEVSSEELQRFNPPQAVVMGRPQIMRGIRMVPVSVYPLQLHSDDAIAFESSEIVVDIKLSQGDAVNPISNPRPVELSSDFAQVVNSFALNPPPDLTPRRDPATTELAGMLILYPEAMDNDDDAEEALEWMNAFADWKRRQGYMVAVEAIDTDELDSDDIKARIQDYYDDDEFPLEFLVIIGNEDDVELNGDDLEYNTQLFFPSFRRVIVIENVEYVVFSEHEYTLLEGDEEDLTPDIILSRIKTPTYERLIGALRKIIDYEATPFTDEEEWFTHALVTVEQNQIGSDYDALIQWERNRLEQKGYDPVDVLNVIIVADTLRGDEIKEVFEEGISIGLAEGMLYGCVQGANWDQWDEDNVAHTGAMSSFNIANLTHYETQVMYPFFASALPDRNNGCVGGLGIFDRTMETSRFMTPIIGSAVTAMTIHDIYSAGSLQLFTKLYLLSLRDREGLVDSYYDDVADAVGRHWTLGDPTVDIYSSVPVQLEVEHDSSFIEGESSIVLEVSADDEPVEGATVCIRQPYEDGIQYVMTTDGEGRAAFTVPEGLEIPEDEDSGILQITVYKHNYIAYVEDVTFENPEVNVILVNPDDNAGFDDSDNGEDADGLIRNGEDVILVLMLTNTGEADATNVLAVLSCNNEWLSFSENEISFGDIEADATEPYQGEVTMSLDDDCPEGTVLRIQAEITVNDEDQIHSVAAFEIETAGPLLAVDHIEVNDGEFIPGSEDIAFAPVIHNGGRFGVSGFTATLESLDERVEVTAAERAYNAIAPDEEGSPAETFRLNIDRLFIPGNKAEFALHIANEDDFETTLFFSKVVIPREAGEPLGPDEYGYICFDCRDTNWVEAPLYHWREINWDVDGWEFHGAKLDIPPNLFDISLAVELPESFNFNYYGIEVENITICTNGWISVSDADTIFTTPHNRPIPGFSAPDGQICILWQQIYNPDPGAYLRGLFYYHIVEEGVFVIEWSGVEVQHRNEDDEVEFFSGSFQILLLDAEVYRTETEDSDIIFQYKEFNSAAGNGEIEDVRYATIGIRNLTGDGGLQYSYWNELADQAHPIEDEFAIRFTTGAENARSRVIGRFMRAENDTVGLEGVTISNIRMHEDITSDAEGNFVINNLRIGHYEDIQVFKEYFNRHTLEFDVEAGRITDLGDIPLTHPEIAVEADPDQITQDDTTDFSLRPDGSELQLRLNVSNQGNGPLDYSVKIVNADGSEPDFRNVRTYGIQNLLNEPWCFGVTYFDSVFYIPGRNQSRRNGQDRNIYRISLTGDTLGYFVSPVARNGSENGITDLTWDGEYLWGAYYTWREERNRIISFNLEGVLHDTLDPDIYFNEGEDQLVLEYVPSRETFFIAKNRESIIYEIDRDANVVNELTLHFPSMTTQIGGLAWSTYDHDDMNLYILDWNPPDGEPLQMQLYKMNVETGEWKFIRTLESRDNSFANGLTFVNNFGDCSRFSVAVVEGRIPLDTLGGDYLRIYDAGPNASFLSDGEITYKSGFVLPDSAIQAGLLLNVSHLPQVDIPFGIRVSHAAAGEDFLYPIILHVTDSSSTGKGKSTLPADFNITSIYPNPFNSMVRIVFTIDRTAPTTIRLYDLIGREIAVLYDDLPRVGENRLIWNGAGVPSGIYFMRLESEGRTRSVKAVILK